MNKEIESVIFSNVGNRLTQELAMGLVMSLAQVLNQAVQAERQAAAFAAGAGPALASPAVAAESGDDGGQPAAIIDPAYQRKRSPVKRPRTPPADPGAAKKPKTAKARR